MTYARSERAREALWRLYRHRGHPTNLDVLGRMLARRARAGALLGYATWAAYVTEDKMIGSADAAAAFVEKIAPPPRRGAPGLRAAARAQAEGRAGRPGRRAVGLRVPRGPGEGRAVRLRLAGGAAVLRVHAGEGRRARHHRAPVRRHLPPRRGRADLAPRRRGATTCTRATGSSAASTSTCTRATDKYKHAAQFTLATGQAGKRLPEGVLVCNFPRPAPGVPALMRAQRRGDVLPRVRPPAAPRPRRPHALGGAGRRRDRVGLRRGALADARGVGARTRRCSRRSRATTRPASPSPPRSSRG